MAGNKVSLINIVGALYGLVAETEVRNCNTAGFLRVILEVSLNIFIGMVAYNLNRVFVCTNGTVSAETPEFTLCSTFSSCVRRYFFGK